MVASTTETCRSKSSKLICLESLRIVWMAGWFLLLSLGLNDLAAAQSETSSSSVTSSRFNLGNAFRRNRPDDTTRSPESIQPTVDRPAELKIIDRRTANRNSHVQPSSATRESISDLNSPPNSGHNPTRPHPEIQQAGYYQTGRSISTPPNNYSPYDQTTPPPNDPLLLLPTPPILFTQPVAPHPNLDPAFDPRFDPAWGHPDPGSQSFYHQGSALPSPSSLPNSNYDTFGYPMSQGSRSPGYIPSHLPDQAERTPSEEHPGFNPAYQQYTDDRTHFDHPSVQPDYFESGYSDRFASNFHTGQGYLQFGSSFHGSKLRAVNKTATEIALELRAENQQLRNIITRMEAELNLKQDYLEQCRDNVKQRELDLQHANQQIESLNARINQLKLDVQQAIQDKNQIEIETTEQLKQIEIMLDNVLMKQLTDNNR